jgi:uncharacterized protein
MNLLKKWRERKERKAWAVREATREVVGRELLLKINASLADGSPTVKGPVEFEVKPPEMPKGVIPKDVKQAQDTALAGVYEYANLYNGGSGFMGFPMLVALSQQPEYRKMVEVIAEEMTRKWIVLRAKGNDDKSKRIAQLNDAMNEFKLRETFHEIALHDGYYGRGQIYIDVKSPNGAPARADNDEMKTALMVDNRKLKKGALLGFRTVEPMWTYPGVYNSNAPLSPDFYNPSTWYVMGQEVHSTRLMTFVSRPVADVLKPAYAFAGISMTQVAMPYVGNWLRTRDSVSDLVNGFSVPILRTNLTGALTGSNGQSEQQRVGLFQKWRNNFGLWVLNAGTPENGGEEFDFKNVPLTGLDALQAQAQEQQSSISSIPLVKLLGITPSGLNASSDGEVRVFYDHINARQERFFRPGLTRALEFIQLSLWGEVDDDIEFMFEKLWEMDGLQASQIRLNDSTTAGNYVTDGALMPEEVRQALADDPDSPYHSIDTSIVPEPPEEEPAIQAAA